MAIEDDLRGLARRFRRCLSVAMSKLSKFYTFFAPTMQFAEMPYRTGRHPSRRGNLTPHHASRCCRKPQSAAVSQSDGPFRTAR
jgi:hypothetical protein